MTNQPNDNGSSDEWLRTWKELNPTPLTDAEGVRFARIMVDFSAGAKVTELVPADFARTLERENAALREQLAEAKTQYNNLRDILLQGGWTPCDIPACNCGRWHHRYGLPERWREIQEELSDAGVLNNSTGNRPLNAVRALREQLAEAKGLLRTCRAAFINGTTDKNASVITMIDAALKAIRALIDQPADQPAKGDDARDARRYRWLRLAGSWNNDQERVTSGPRTMQMRFHHAEHLDSAIDAAMQALDAPANPR